MLVNRIHKYSFSSITFFVCLFHFLLLVSCNLSNDIKPQALFLLLKFIVLIYTLLVLHIDYYTVIIFIAETSAWTLKNESILDSQGAAFHFAVKMCLNDYTECSLYI